MSDAYQFIQPSTKYSLIRTDSLAETQQLQSTYNSSIRVEQLDRHRRFHWQASRIPIGPLALMSSKYGARLRAVSGEVTSYSLVIARRGSARVSQGKQTRVASTGADLVLISPRMEASCELETNYEGLQLHIPTLFLEKLLETCTEALALPGIPGALDIARARAGPSQRLIDYILEEASHDPNIFSNPAVGEHIAEALSLSLIDVVAPPSTDRRLHKHGAIVPWYVVTIEEYLVANATRPVKMQELAALTSVSIRAIQAAFRRCRGYTITQFLHDYRLGLARKAILASPPTVSISTIALESGFMHIGRFSTAYRRRYGEPPSQTRRRLGRG